MHETLASVDETQDCFTEDMRRKRWMWDFLTLLNKECWLNVVDS